MNPHGLKELVFILETSFQGDLKRELRVQLPGCIVTKTDPTDIQGIPDLLIVWGKQWAALECKKSAKASTRPNQPYYVDLMNEMSFAAFIYPENRREVLDALYRTFRANR